MPNAALFNAHGSLATPFVVVILYQLWDRVCVFHAGYMRRAIRWNKPPKLKESKLLSNFFEAEERAVEGWLADTV